MGVPLSVWAETMLRHPLQFTYSGLSGRGKTPQQVIQQDERTYSRYVEDYMESQYKYNLSEDQTPYFEEYLARCQEDGDEPDSREDWARNQADFDCECAVDDNTLLPSDEHLLQKHPIDGVWSHASTSKVELEDVLMICPGCGREPIDVNYDGAGGGRTTRGFYCGLCGASSRWRDEEDMYDTMLAIGVVPWPFVPEKREGFYSFCRKNDQRPFYPDDKAEYEAWLAKQEVQT